MKGLESFTAEDGNSLPDLTKIQKAHRTLFFSVPHAPLADRLHCIDDAYWIWGEIDGIDHTLAVLDPLKSLLSHLPALHLDTTAGIKTIRVTASVLGKHNHSRYEIEDTVGRSLSEGLHLTYMNSQSEGAPGVVWCRFHISGNKGLVGMRARPRPLHHRAWRTKRPYGGPSLSCGSGHGTLSRLTPRSVRP